MSEDRLRWIAFALMVVMAGVEVWALDHASNGAMLEPVKRKARQQWDRLVRSRRIDETVATEAGSVVWEAMQVVEQEGDQP